jgi:hypothetical protein
MKHLDDADHRHAGTTMAVDACKILKAAFRPVARREVVEVRGQILAETLELIC